MKNYFKINNLFVLPLLILLITSCEKDDSDSEDRGVKYLISLTDINRNPNHGPYHGKDTLVYENGRVTKAYIASDCQGYAYQYEYGSNNKISKIYRAVAGYSGEYDVEEMFENATLDEYDTSPMLLKYDSKDRLIEIIFSVYEYTYFDYDEKGRLFRKTTSSETYTVTQFDENGNPLEFTYDNGDIDYYNLSYSELKNPYFDLFKKFGLVEIDCALGNSFITPNAITRGGTRSGRRITYNSDGVYPESAKVNYDGGSVSTFKFKYR